MIYMLILSIIEAGVIGYLLYRLDTNKFLKEIIRLRRKNNLLLDELRILRKMNIGLGIAELVSGIIGKFLR